MDFVTYPHLILLISGQTLSVTVALKIFWKLNGLLIVATASVPMWMGRPTKTTEILHQLQPKSGHGPSDDGEIAQKQSPSDVQTWDMAHQRHHLSQNIYAGYSTAELHNWPRLFTQHVKLLWSTHICNGHHNSNMLTLFIMLTRCRGRWLCHLREQVL